jgi:RNA polymerase sigma-70 factor (ECF subfamily)
VYLDIEMSGLAAGAYEVRVGADWGLRANAGDSTLDDLAFVYAFIYRRVGNPEDAEDLTQEVALRALPRLHRDRSLAAIRAYLVATARSVLANFWTQRLGMPVTELPADLGGQTHQPVPSRTALDEVERVLSLLPAHYRKLLELRFLRGYSTKEVAQELGTTVGAVKVMQLRALRAAAKLGAA